MLVGIHGVIPGLGQKQGAGSAHRPICGVQGGNVLGHVHQRLMIARVDAQGIEKAGSHGIVQVHAGDSLHQAAHDPRAEVGILVLAAGRVLVEVAPLLGGIVQQGGQGAAGFGVAALGVQGGGMGHQMTQGDRRVPHIGVGDAVPEIGADVLVQIQEALLHQLHDVNGGDHLRHGSRAEVGVLADGNARLLVSVAVEIFVDDLAVFGHIHGCAGGLVAAEHLGDSFVQAVFLGQAVPKGHQHKTQNHRNELLYGGRLLCMRKILCIVP